MKAKPADTAAPVTPLEHEYANAIEGIVAIISARTAAMSEKPKLEPTDAGILNLFGQALSSLQKGAIWSARTIRAREKRAKADK